MLKKKIPEEQFLYNFKIEDHIPNDHFLRLVKTNINFDFIYKKVEHLYSHTGQPAVDPVVLIKMLLIGYFYNIKSERQLVKEIQVNLAYRWFINYGMDEKIPDHSTISQTRRRKFKNSKLFEEIFDEILRKCIEKGYVNGETILTDSTFIKANASIGSLKELPKKIEEYLKELENNAEEVIKKKSEKKLSNQTHISKTDPESKLADKRSSNFPLGLYYHEHRSIDLSGYITDVYVTPGNVKEHEPYLQRILRQKLVYQLPIKNLVGDRAYGMPEIYKKTSELGFNLFASPKYEGRKKEGFFERKEFKYLKDQDVYQCPAGEILKKKTYEAHRTRWTYSGKWKTCRACEKRNDCIDTRGKIPRPKTFVRNDSQNIIDEIMQKKDSLEWKYYMNRRRVLCEGSYGDAKANHGLGKAKFRGLKSVQEQSLMTAIAQNIKKLIKDLKGKTSLSLQNLKNIVEIKLNIFFSGFCFELKI